MRVVRLIFCDVRMTKWMQHADMFEPWKVLVCPTVRATVVEDFSPAHVQRLVRASRDEPYRLIACIGDGVDWVDPDVRVVSTGEQWTPIENYVNHIKAAAAEWATHVPA